MKSLNRLRLLVLFTVFLIACLLGGKRAEATHLQSDKPETDSIITQKLHDKVGGDVTNSAPINSDPDLQPGFPVQTLHTPGTLMTGPVINTRVGNINSDPQLEIVVSGLVQGPLYAFNYMGNPVSGWPVYFYNLPFYTSLGNLSLQSPGLEIFTGQYLIRLPETPPGPMIAYTGGGMLLPGWSKNSEYVISGPASLADLDGDGLDEIIIYEGKLDTYAYKADGTLLPGWPINGEDPAQAIADLDGDGDLEIVTINNWTSNGAYLVAYHHNGSQVDGFSVPFDPYSHVHPLIGDVDGDQSPEIMVFTHITAPPYMEILIISSSGVIERRRPASMKIGNYYAETQTTPALADMDGDGVPEIIIGLTGGIMVWKGDVFETLPGYPVVWGSYQDYWNGNNAPVVGDIDGDQNPEIVVINQLIGSSTTGDIHVYDRFGNLNPHFPKTIEIGLGAVPAIADIDLDGRNELIITGAFWNGEVDYFDKVWAYDLGGSNHGSIEWGQFGGGPQNWGSYPAPPTYSGPNLYISTTPSKLEIPPDKTVHFMIDYGNKGVTMAASVTLSATLDAGMAYIGDTSGITPMIDGQNIIWNLPNVGYLIERQFRIDLQLPDDATDGDHYTVEFFLSSDQPEADFSGKDNSSFVNIWIAEQALLPFVHK